MSSIHRYLVLPLGIFAAASLAQAPTNTLASQAAQCSAFFGLLSQSDTESAQSYKQLAHVFTAYFVELVPADQLDSEISRSQRNIAAMVTKAREENDAGAVKQQVTACFDALKKMETDVWPKMSETQRNLLPRISQ